MIDKQISRLAEISNKIGSKRGQLDEATKTGQTGKKSSPTGGRYSRKTDLSGIKVKSTRPKTDRGVSFHLQHKFITKGRHESASYNHRTPAAAHQSYIERGSALDVVENDPWRSVDKSTADSLFGNDDQVRGGKAFSRLEFHHDAAALNFGTIGATKQARKSFWETVELHERKNGRIQQRIIGEVPHELDNASRLELVRDFCRLFEERELPYWCSVHAPGEKNDPRNNHYHIAYYDRPCRKDNENRWDFEQTKKIKMANGVWRDSYVYRQDKDKDVTKRDWVKMLRRRFSDVANYHASVAGIDKRYDPRSYKDAGISKSAGEHLGTKRAAAEKQGLTTEVSVRNAWKEVAWRIGDASTKWSQRQHLLQDILDRNIVNVDSITNNIIVQDDLANSDFMSLLEEGRMSSQKKEMHQIAIEAVTLRIDDREDFLARESDRLLWKPAEGNEASSWALSILLDNERDLILEAREEMSDFVKSCQKVILGQEKRLKYLEKTSGDIFDQIEKENLNHSPINNKSVNKDKNSNSSEYSAANLAWSIRQKTQEILQDDFLTEVNGISEDEINELIQTLPKVGKSKTTEKSKNTSIVDDIDYGTNENDLASLFSNSDDSFEEQTKISKKKTGEGGGTGGVETTSNNFDFDEVVVNTDHDKESNKHHNTASVEDGGTDSLNTFGKSPEILQHDPFPRAISLSSSPDAKDVRELEDKLDKMSNAELRSRYVVTRDAADFIDNKLKSAEYTAALAVIDDMAKQRGLDLHTGIHSPEKATNINKANLHTDSNQELKTGQFDPWLQKQRIRKK